MTYEEAQIKIDDSTQHDSLAKCLRGLNSLAKILKKRRIENGFVITIHEYGIDFLIKPFGS
jgi:exosome complex exonuclease DIS3/RRP44